LILLVVKRKLPKRGTKFPEYAKCQQSKQLTESKSYCYCALHQMGK
jgi:hypothetical protein